MICIGYNVASCLLEDNFSFSLGGPRGLQNPERPEDSSVAHSPVRAVNLAILYVFGMYKSSTFHFLVLSRKLLVDTHTDNSVPLPQRSIISQQELNVMAEQ